MEIPLTSEVVLLDSVRSQNFGGEENRILVGQYQDEAFGTVTSRAFAQIFPANITTSIPGTAILDSSILTLQTDFFQYGTAGITEEKFSIHEVDQTLKLEGQTYFSKTVTPFSPSKIGEGTLKVDAIGYKKEFDDTNTNPTVTLKVKLDPGYGERLLRAINKDDKAFTEFTNFREAFKGVAILPSVNKKIVGFTLGANQSFITLYYRDGDQKLAFSFYLNTAVNYSNITSNRTGTNFASINDFYRGYPNNGKVGIQSGLGIITKVNFKNFYNHIDTIPNLILNSAELVVSNVETQENIHTPLLGLAMLRDNNRLFSVRRTDNKANVSDSSAVTNFKGLLQAQGSVYLASSDNPQNPFVMNYNPTNKLFSGVCTLFLQELYALRKKNLTYENFSLYPVFPVIGKSVYRTAFDANQIKLRLYYTRPLTSR